MIVCELYIIYSDFNQIICISHLKLQKDAIEDAPYNILKPKDAILYIINPMHGLVSNRCILDWLQNNAGVHNIPINAFDWMLNNWCFVWMAESYITLPGLWI